MATAAHSVRLCVRICRPTISAARVGASRALWPASWTPTTSTTRRRPLSTTTSRRDGRQRNDHDEEEDEDHDEADSPNVKREPMPAELAEKLEEMLDEMRSAVQPLNVTLRAKRDSMWYEDEVDTELITNEINEDDFKEDDITSMAHGKLEEHREHRQYMRVAVWEMPLLSQFAKPFEPPTGAQPLRFRYTSFLGEVHAAEKKVVVEFCPRDLPLTAAEQLKLKKLVGPRYNPEKDIVRMGCDMYEYQAQNKRYLGDMVDKLIAEARDHTDMFEDVPLDLRHHKPKRKLKFPNEWRMSADRLRELTSIRLRDFKNDKKKENRGLLIDGRRILIENKLYATPPRELVVERVGRD